MKDIKQIAKEHGIELVNTNIHLTYDEAIEAFTKARRLANA